MASYYDEVEVSYSSTMKMNKPKLIPAKQIEDMEFDEENLLFHSPCPCGDRFEISLVCSNFVNSYLLVTNFCDLQTQIQEGEDIARCPSCSLMIRVIYDSVSYPCNESLLTLKDDFVDDEKSDGKEVNSMTVEVAV